MTSNTLIFLAVNIAGVYIHDRTQHAQRKAFLDTRNCIAARLHMEDENEKLVRLHLTGHVYMCPLNWHHLKETKLGKRPQSQQLPSLFPRAYQWRIQDFPEVGAPTLQGRQHTILPSFPKKLHEIERIWIGGRIPHIPLRSANEYRNGVVKYILS